jgi:hypothetical protein
MKIKFTSISIIAISISILLLLITNNLINTSPVELSKYSDIASIISIFVSVIGIFLLLRQLKEQSKKEKIELILKLSADFYNNEKLMSVFEFIDRRDPNIINKDLKKIIEGGCVKGFKEINLNNYMNFFNSLAILIEDNVVLKNDIMKLFRYQLEKTFALEEIIYYMEEFGFERIKMLLPNEFFFYGTLKFEFDREKEDNLKDVYHFLKNKKEYSLTNYCLESVGSKNEFMGMVKCAGFHQKPVKGFFVSIAKNSNWYKLLKDLDYHEDVGNLYNRCIVLLDGNKYTWVYMKKIETQRIQSITTSKI